MDSSDESFKTPPDSIDSAVQEKMEYYSSDDDDQPFKPTPRATIDREKKRPHEKKKRAMLLDDSFNVSIPSEALDSPAPKFQKKVQIVSSDEELSGSEAADDSDIRASTFSESSDDEREKARRKISRRSFVNLERDLISDGPMTDNDDDHATEKRLVRSVQQTPSPINKKSFSIGGSGSAQRRLIASIDETPPPRSTGEQKTFTVMLDESIQMLEEAAITPRDSRTRENASAKKSPNATLPLNDEMDISDPSGDLGRTISTHFYVEHEGDVIEKIGSVPSSELALDGTFVFRRPQDAQETFTIDEDDAQGTPLRTPESLFGSRGTCVVKKEDGSPGQNDGPREAQEVFTIEEDDTEAKTERTPESFFRRDGTFVVKKDHEIEDSPIQNDDRSKKPIVVLDLSDSDSPGRGKRSTFTISGRQALSPTDATRTPTAAEESDLSTQIIDSDDDDTGARPPRPTKKVPVVNISDSDSDSSPTVTKVEDDDSVVEEEPGAGPDFRAQPQVPKEQQSRFLRGLFRQLETIPVAGTDEAETPEWMSVELLPHQKYGLKWMQWREEQGNGGVLADEMGLGKTTSAISLVVSYLKALEADEFFQEQKARREKAMKLASAENRRKLKGTFSTLIVVPSSVVNQWNEEMENKVQKEYALRVYCYTQTRAKRDRLDDKVLRQADVVLTTYDIVRGDVLRKGPEHHLDPTSKLAGIFWKRIILDEAHVIRNPSTAGNAAICAVPADCRWALTGTPIHNKLTDLYALVKFMDILPFADFTFWKEKMEGSSKECANRVNTLVHTILLHRNKDILKLPERVNHDCRLQMDGDEKKAYEMMLDSAQMKVEEFLEERAGGHSTFGNRKKTRAAPENSVFGGVVGKEGKLKMHVILVVLLRLRQAAIHFSLTTEALNMDAFDGLLEDVDTDYLEKLDGDMSRSFGRENQKYSIFDAKKPSTKIAKVLELSMEIVERGESVVVVSQWTGVLGLIADHLDEASVRYAKFDGSMNRDEKAEVVRKFVQKKTIPILLLSLASGGVGLNLQTCSNLIMVDPHWNPQLEEQACARIHRHGQKNAVNIYKIICEGTIEERVLQLQERKKQLAGGVLTGHATKQSAKLTLDDLRFLFGTAVDVPASRKGQRKKGRTPLHGIHNFDLPGFEDQ
ncbi:unnamed protein product, partial [Mesorhabditis spiculigera]